MMMMKTRADVDKVLYCKLVFVFFCMFYFRTVFFV